jgi:hypothetical protein
MLTTVTNTSGVTINGLDSFTTDSGQGGPAVLTATGGARKFPLPYPFAHIGALANSGTKQLPMHPQDWRFKPVPYMPFEPRDEWQTLVQRGIVTLAYASQTGRRDVEELFETAV